MSNIPIFERMAWFHQEVRAKKYPNASNLAVRFELSRKTAQRNIDFMRDRAFAPLEYNFSKKGYSYTDESFELPRFPVTQDEILAVLISRNLLAHSAGGLISKAINRYSQKVFAVIDDPMVSSARLDEAFSATWPGYSPADSAVFRKVTEALLANKVLEFSYLSPGKQENTERRAEPCHMQHYMGSWVLVAWCTLRSDWRKFYLSRMSNVLVSSKPFEPRPAEQWKSRLDNAFGIFQGEEQVSVTLRFTPFRAAWIKEQFWHPDQKLTERTDNSLELTLPVADFREIKMKVLQFGADVEVISPDSLREEIVQEIQRMRDLYGQKE